MSSFIEEIDNYILQYYSCVIEDPKERKKLVDKTRFIVNRNISEFGLPGLKTLHKTLEAILDNHQLGKTTSLDQSLTSDGFNLYKIIPSDTNFSESNHDLKKGKELLQLLNKTLSKQDFQSLINLLGGVINTTFLLGKSNLRPKDILKKPDLPDYIKWASRLSPPSVKLQEKYNRFKIGLSRHNPIQRLDSINLPIVQRVISEVYKQKTTPLGKSLDQTGFYNLVSNEGGLTKLIEKTNPELLHKIPYLHKWNKGQKSVEIALSAIGEVLYTLQGYKNAEKTNNREEQVRIINEWITKEKGLSNYFNKKGLRGLMAVLIDQKGKLGLKKAYSPKSLLEFYSEKKGLNWFDRTKETYIQGWRLGEKNIWQRGEESAQLGIECIEDVLYTLPGYKNAEKTNNREEQIKIINELILKEKRLQDYFNKNGLGSLMSSLIDPTGKLGLRKSGSPKCLLEFYSERKGLNWFDRTKETYVQGWKIKEKDIWQRGDRSIKFAIECIEDVLYELPGYKNAEKTNNREEQIRIINQLITKEKRLADYFYKNGLSSLINIFLGSINKDLRKSGSSKSLLKFYSEIKGLNWFDQSKFPYITNKGNGRLIFVYDNIS